MRRGERTGPRGSGGFTYAWVLMAVALLGVAMARIGPAWTHSVQRDRERELIRVGVAYAQAIERYYYAQPLRQYPERLEQLVLDERFTSPTRHLRDLYSDPMRPGLQMEALMSADGKIVGVRSRSDLSPLRTEPWTDGRRTLQPARQYSAWQFMANVER